MSRIDELLETMQEILDLYDTTSIWSMKIFTYVGENYHKIQTLIKQIKGSHE